MTISGRSIVRDETRSRINALPIACSLSGPDLAERRRELAGELFSGVLRVEETEDGYAFDFPGDEEWALKLVGFVNAERKCCPFFVFELAFEPEAGPIQLRIKGPEGAKEMVAEIAAPRSP